MWCGRLLVVIAIGAAGCSKGHADLGGGALTDAPPRPPDAAIEEPSEDAPDAAEVMAHVCLVTDLRNITTCDSGGPGAQLVTLGNQVRTTSPNGTFMFVPPTGTDLFWHVSGNGIRSSRMNLRRAANGDLIMPISIPVIGEAAYQTLFAANGGVEAANQGALVIQFIRDAPPGPLAGVTVSGIGTLEVLYDGVSPTIWDTDETGPRGMAWIPSVPAGMHTYDAAPQIGNGPVDRPFVVEDATITFDIVEPI
ncbi:MAG: hypothetical protein ABI867_33230 [Kofleriaceae bacterium]